MTIEEGDAGLKRRSVDVLVLGGGTSGVAAACQAARMGATVLLAEESPWLGGMLTAAGVSCIDGNEGPLAGGVFRRFRDAMEEHYGGREAVRTGWVSNTCFDPRVAARWFASKAERFGVEVRHGCRPVLVLRDDDRVRGAVLEQGGEREAVTAHVTIDATELGDGLQLGRVPFRLGRDARSDTGEPDAPEEADFLVQDLTWVAILRAWPDRAPAVPRPTGYDPAVFDGATAIRTPSDDPAWMNHALHDWDSFLSYGRLPGDRYMLNWPFHANDFPMTPALFTAAGRAAAFGEARARTLAFVHYIQNELGHPEIGIDPEVFGTSDGLAYIPYIRESRRMIGVATIAEGDVVPAPGRVRPARHRDSVAVGDYPLDHHHWRHHLPPGQRVEIDYPKTAPFQVPYRALVPARVDGLLAVEKNLSVTHIANGCVRLQPVVLAIGQAAGAAAAVAADRGCEPRDVDVAHLQDLLLDDRAVLVPYRDVDPTHPAFPSIQRIGLGTGEDEPYEFRPDERVDEAALDDIARAWDVPPERVRGCFRPGMIRADLARAVDVSRR